MGWLTNLLKKKNVGSSTITPNGKRWVTVRVCANCEEVLTEDEQLKSNGVCPYCSHKSGTTVCLTNEKQELR